MGRAAGISVANVRVIMKFRYLASLVSCAAALVSQAHATIVVSGDYNISVDLSTYTENAQLFTNILGDGTSVLVDGSASYRGLTHNYYNGLAGVTSKLGGLSASSLVGVDLFVSVIPTAAYSASQVSALRGFLDNGGTAFLIGENHNFAGPNGYLNALLSGLGSSLSIAPNSTFDNGYHTTADIVSSGLTSGVDSIRYAAPSVVSGGTALVRGSNQQVFIAVDEYDEGPSGVPDNGSSLLLLGLGLVGLVASRRR